MDRGSLSNIQLYYTPAELIQESSLIISGEEVQHIYRVMRNKIGDQLKVTDGLGNTYSCKIERIDKKVIHCSITEKKYVENLFKNLVVCVPRLKSADRFELALEKCVELGITNFIIFESERTIGKGNKSGRWQKILLSAMKQCKRAHIPQVTYLGSFNKLNDDESVKIIFEQDSAFSLKNLLRNDTLHVDNQILLVFGPEGGLSKNEINSIENKSIVNISNNRLRSETAIISAVSIITHHLTAT